MPRLSRWFIKTGLIYFIIGLAMGCVLLAQPVFRWSSGWQVLRPVYLHFLFIGWVTQIIMGVGYWMFPKYSKETRVAAKNSDGRYSFCSTVGDLTSHRRTDDGVITPI